MRVQAWWRIGSAAALAAVLAGATMPAGAQVTSEKRIPVKKESGGDVARRDSIARADSMRRDSLAMAQARFDSLARVEAAYRDSVARAEQAMRDSIARAELARAEQARLDSIARADSVRNAAALAAAAAAAIPVSLSQRGFYAGIAGGMSTPYNKWEDPYKTGWNITVPFGWQPGASRFGVRADISYDSHGGESFTGNSVPLPGGPTVTPFATSNIEVNNASIWSGNLDLTVDVFQWGSSRFSSLYLLGGIGWSSFNTPEATITPVSGGTPTVLQGKSGSEFGWNGGAGIGFSLGRSSLFLESRYFTADTPNVKAEWIPVILGVRWY